LDIFGGSDPPYELLSFGLVLERPMTLLWLHMNSYDTGRFLRNRLSLTELLHMYRLCGYLFITSEDYIKNIVVAILRSFVQDKEDAKDALKAESNRATLTEILNRFFKQISIPANELKVRDLPRSFDAKVLTKLLTQEEKKTLERLERGFLSYKEINRLVISKILNQVKQYPDIQKALNYIPVYGEEDRIVTFAERKALANSHSLGRLNLEWKEKDGNLQKNFIPDNPDSSVTLSPEIWGENFIKFNIKIRQGPGILALSARALLRLREQYYIAPLNPILAD